MRLLFTILTFFVFSNNLFSQEEDHLARLLHKLDSISEDTSRILTLIEISDYYISSNLDSSFFYTDKSLKQAQKINFKRGIMLSHGQLGILSLHDNNMDKAREHYLQVLEPARQINSTEELLIALRILGNISFTLGDYPEALDYWLEGNTLAQENEYFEVIPEFYSNIGNLYYQIGDYDRAYLFFDLSRKTAMEYGRTDLYPNALNNMAFIEYHNENYDKTSDYARQILDLVDSIPNTVNFVPAAYEHLGASAFMQKKYDTALVEYHNMLNSLHQVNEMICGPIIIEEVRAYSGIGKCHLKLDQLKQAEKFLKKGYFKAKEANILEPLSELAALLSEVYEESGKMTEALEYYKIYKASSDSLFGNEKIREITRVRMENEFAVRQKIYELEDAHKDSVQKRKENIYLFIIVSFVLGITILILLYRLQLSKTIKTRLSNKNLNLKLDFKNQELTCNVLSMLKKNELLINISDQIKKIRLNSNSNNKPMLDEVIKGIERSSKEIGWEEFELRFNEVHAEFYERLNERFPNLSINEKRLCAFLKLNMTTKDISAITFQSYNSIRMARSRMRKKIGIDENENLVAFLNQL